MKHLSLQIWVLFAIIFMNFIAQVPYTIHLYEASRLLSIFPGTIMMYAVFLLFLVSTFLFSRKNKGGYWLLVIFLSLEFLFYLWNFVGSLMHGFPLFFQMYNPDILLRIVFAIGYLNLFASGYFLFLLLSYKKHLLK